jgi:hypothetical protein
MSARGNISMTPAAIREHCEKHKLPVPEELERVTGIKLQPFQKAIISKIAGELPKPVQMSRPEREMGMILEAQKRNGEIVDYRFQGMSLAYSPDPETGILLRYKCDYVVIVGRMNHLKPCEFAAIRIIECKGHGKHAISAAAKLRFKGAKAAWPMFKFEMHQRGKDGQWRRVL